MALRVLLRVLDAKPRFERAGRQWGIVKQIGEDRRGARLMRQGKRL